MAKTTSKKSKTSAPAKKADAAKKTAVYEPGGKSATLRLSIPKQEDLPAARRGVKKVVVAYSGGLDTSVMIPWLRENYGCEVVAYAADLGQGGDTASLKAKAKATGASKCIVMDLREEFVNNYIIPAIQAHALYEGRYHMHTSLGRPLIAQHQVDVALAEGADAVAHGCTGKGNDQARFEFTFMALAPDLRIIAPLREWEMKSRDDEFEYAESRGIHLPIKRHKPYSIDKNLYGLATECGELEDPWTEAPEDAYQDTINPEKAPAKPEDVIISFEAGVPTAVNGKAMKPLKIVETLAEIGNRHGVGRIDMVENRLVGIKSREVYEGPAALLLIAAHREIESLVHDRELTKFKETICTRFTHIIYDGMWFSPLREALQAFIKETQANVTGDVKLRLFRGGFRPIARRSPFSLYDKSLATYDAGDRFDHTKAEGFLALTGMPLVVRHRVMQNLKRGKAGRGK